MNSSFIVIIVVFACLIPSRTILGFQPRPILVRKHVTTEKKRYTAAAHSTPHFVLRLFPSKLKEIGSTDTSNSSTDSTCVNDASTVPKPKEVQGTSIIETSIQNFISETILLGIPPSSSIYAIMAIYFVEGALGLASLARTFLLKDELHMGPAELSALTGLFTLPWTIKPLYGFLSDGVPLFGYRRRSYLILCGFLGSICYAGVATNFFGVLQWFQGYALNDFQLLTTIASLVVSSGCIAFSDVVADGIVVQKTREADLAGQTSIAGGLQSLCWGSASLGALISAYYSGSLLQTFTPQQVLGFTAFLPLIVAIFAFGIEEEKIKQPALQNTSSNNLNNISFAVDFQPDQNLFPPAAIPSQNELKDQNKKNRLDDDDGTTLSLKEQIEMLWRAIQMPSVWKPALFLFLWQSTPTSDGAFLYFMTNDLGLGPEFLGRVRLATAVASFVGVWGYQTYLRQVSIKSILLWSSIASAPLGLIQLLLITHANRDLGIPDGAFVFGDDVVLAVLGQFAFLPTLVLAAKICPPGIEAVLFATLMSIFNGASTVGTELGAVLTKYLGVTENDFSNLWLLNIICNVSSLYPLIFIGLLDGVGSQSISELEDDETTI